MKNLHSFSIWCVVVLFLLVGVIASIWDFQISQFAFNPDSPWGIWIEKYGEIPGLVIAIWALLLINVSLDISFWIWRWLLHILNWLLAELLLEYAIFRGIASWLALEHIEDLLLFAERWGLVVRWSAISTILIAWLLLRAFAPGYCIRQKRFSKIAIWQMALSQLFIQVLKAVWGRVRFRELSQPGAEFSPWYIPQGVVTSDSFPSGHAGLGWMLLPLFLLFTSFGRKVQMFVLSLSICWAITVSSGRVVVGAHYSSDVWFGGLVTVMPFMLFYYIYTQDKMKN